MLIYTVIYIKLIRIKYLLHRIGNSTEQIVITCMREKKKKKQKKNHISFSQYLTLPESAFSSWLPCVHESLL